MAVEQLLVYTIAVTFIVVVTSGRMCPDIFQLNDVCTIPGKKTAFHCLIYSDTDTYPMYWEYEPDADTGKSRIAQNEQVVEGLRHKYEADIFNVNRTHSCAQLAINVDEDDPDKAYYMCAFGHEQLWAQLRLSTFKSNDLKARLSLTELEGDEPNSTVIEIVAVVTDFWGIPGLELKLYVDDQIVKIVPGGSLKCEESPNAYLKHSLLGQPGRDLNIKLTYTHQTLNEEKVLNEVVFRNKRRQPTVSHDASQSTMTTVFIIVFLLLAVALLGARCVILEINRRRRKSRSKTGTVETGEHEATQLMANNDCQNESVAVSNVHDFARVEASTSTEKTSESLRVVEQAVKYRPSEPTKSSIQNQDNLRKEKHGHEASGATYSEQEMTASIGGGDIPEIAAFNHEVNDYHAPEPEYFIQNQGIQQNEENEQKTKGAASLDQELLPNEPANNIDNQKNEQNEEEFRGATSLEQQRIAGCGGDVLECGGIYPGMAYVEMSLHEPACLESNASLLPTIPESQDGRTSADHDQTRNTRLPSVQRQKSLEVNLAENKVGWTADYDEEDAPQLDNHWTQL